MAEPLTFKFVFEDESPASGQQQQAPPEAAPSATPRTSPTLPDETQPQPRRPAPRRQPRQSASAEQEDRPRDRGARPPRREDQSTDSGHAARLISEMVRDLASLPGIGKSIGSLSRTIEPLLQARQRIADLGERRRVEAERAARDAERDRERPVARRPTATPAEETQAHTRTSALGLSQLAPTEIPAPKQPEEDSGSGDQAENIAARHPGTLRTLNQIQEDIGDLVAHHNVGPNDPKIVALVDELKELIKATFRHGFAQRARELIVNKTGYAEASDILRREFPQFAKHAFPDLYNYFKSKTPFITDAEREVEDEKKTPSPRPQPDDLSQLSAPGPATITPADVRPSSASIPVGGGMSGPAPAAAEAGAEAAGGAEVAAGGLGALGGPAGIVAAIAVVAVVRTAGRAFSELVGTVQRVDRTFTQLSERLAPFNGRLAFAQAQARTQQTLLDIERAGRLGGNLAKFTDERARLSREVQRLATELESAVLPAINGAATLLADVVQGVRESVSAMSDLLGGLLEGISQSDAATAAATKGMNKRMDAAEADRKSKEMMDVAGVFFGQPGHEQDLNIGGVDYGSASDWAAYVPQASPRRINNQRAFGGI